MTTEPIMLAIINRRKKANISQGTAAEWASLSLKTYQRIERGESDIRMINATRLLKKMGVCNLDILLDMMEVTPPSVDDVAAIARLLPPEGRLALIKMLISIYKDRFT